MDRRIASSPSSSWGKSIAMVFILIFFFIFDELVCRCSKHNKGDQNSCIQGRMDNRLAQMRTGESY